VRFAVLQFVLMEGCGHMPHEECPERFIVEVQRFVESLE
jgi:pimeloyl-ACP methyl ester carboxylesterase